MRQFDAASRFGWGGRSDADRAPPEWRAWLAAQLDGEDAARFDGLGDSADGLIALRTQRAQKMQGDPLVKPIFQAEAAAQLSGLLVTEQPFRERLAWFWLNHFTVSVRQGGVRGIVGAYMREAIRPHVTGRFVDMLTAVMRHPAMLMYLDNNSSIGPDSPSGRRQHKGLNENLARECLELHTVSPASGYTQEDVTAFAAVLTGWTVDMKAERPGFAFNARAHERGEKIVMGQRFPEGEEGGLAALQFLGTHPATWRHIATQMVRHFIADAPSPADVAQVSAALSESGGDLRRASLALIGLRSAGGPAGKFRSPMDYSVAVMRALSLSGEGNGPDDPRSPAHQLQGAFSALGQPLWTAPLPNGWSDLAADWSAPSDMLARTDWAWRVSGQARDADPLEVAHVALGPALRHETLLAMQHAASRQDALALLFSSPEFQRR